MKRLLALSSLLLLSSCAQQLMMKMPPHWELAKGKDVADAREGKYHKSVDRMMDLTQYMFETHGFRFYDRDDDAKIFKTDPYKDPVTKEESFVTVAFTDENGVTLAKWKYFKIVKYVNEEVGKDDAAFQKELAEDWNWRLYQQLP